MAHPPEAAPTFDRAGSDPKAVAIADKVIAASGGAARWAAAKELRWSESATGSAEPVTFDQAWDRWDGRHYARLRTPQGDIVVMHPVYTPGGTAFHDQNGQQARLGAAETERAVTESRDRWNLDTAGLFMAFLLEEPGTKLALVGEVAPEQGAPVGDEIKVTFAAKDARTGTFYVIVNRTTNLIDRLESVKPGDPDNKRLAYKLDQFKDVAGLHLPTVLHNVGLPSEVITFSNVLANAEADESLYVPTVQ